jgi:hypothetical protein
MISTKKKIIVGVSILVFVTGVYLLTKKGKDGTSILGPKKPKYIDEGDINLIPVFSAKQKVSILYDAMNKYNGTDETLIFEALTDVTQSQFGLINKAFGLKNYNRMLGYNTYGGTNLPLKTWLREELSDSEYNLLRKKFPIYL